MSLREALPRFSLFYGAIIAVQLFSLRISHHDTHRNALSHARRHDAVIFKQIQAAVDAIVLAVGKLDGDGNINFADPEPIFLIARNS